MPTLSLTLKLPFLNLNRAKAAEFTRLEAINTALANRILAMPKAERRGLTTASFKEVELGSAWVNQTLRNVQKARNVQRFKRLPLEVNNQNWTLHRVGETYSIAFGLLRGVHDTPPGSVSLGGSPDGGPRGENENPTDLSVGVLRSPGLKIRGSIAPTPPFL